MNNQLRTKRSLESYKTQKKHSSLYSTSIIVGVCIAVYVYVLNFDNYSETQLVRMTTLWFFPIVFGYYGFVAQWLQANFQKQQFIRPKGLLLSIGNKAPVVFIRPLLIILHLPLLVPYKKPIYVAISGSLIWSVWLLIFFEVIFPRL